MTKDEFLELVAAEVPRDVLEQLVADDRNNLGPDYDRADEYIAEAIWNALVGKVPPWMKEARPFAKGGHARGCWYQSGGPCDCTVNEAEFYRLGRVGAEDD